LNSLVAVGAVVAPAGRLYGYDTPVEVAGVHVELLSQVGAAGAEVTVVAPAGNELLPDLNTVEVAVTFQPAPEPVASAMSSGCGVVTALSWPFRLVDGKFTAPGVVANASEPAVKVAEALVAKAGAAISSMLLTAAAATGSIVRSFIRVLPFIRFRG
jgi:hypothetical protein